MLFYAFLIHARSKNHALPKSKIQPRLGEPIVTLSTTKPNLSSFLKHYTRAHGVDLQCSHFLQCKLNISRKYGS